MSRTFISAIVAASIAITGFSAAPARADDDVARALAGLTTLFILGKIISDDNSSSKSKVVVQKPQPKVVYVHPKPKKKVVYVQPRQKVVHVHPKTKTKVVRKDSDRRTGHNDHRRDGHRNGHMPRRYDNR